MPFEVARSYVIVLIAIDTVLQQEMDLPGILHRAI